ncbi:hypothetical protein GCM10009549_32110 [Streptomyces thermoalcalitolerans]|uniref:Uncharacterized protein n=1 Tax=Streptomyces thermoalcalitolerans TaxID=65605 RepID=A0ABN1NTS6_9ACTN
MRDRIVAHVVTSPHQLRGRPAQDDPLVGSARGVGSSPPHAAPPGTHPKPWGRPHRTAAEGETRKGAARMRAAPARNEEEEEEEEDGGPACGACSHRTRVLVDDGADRRRTTKPRSVITDRGSLLRGPEGI